MKEVSKVETGEQFLRLALCYPREEPEIFEKRKRQLEKLGVERLIPEGKVQIGKFYVLGKGCTSIVVKALRRGEIVVLKIRRTDSDRSDVLREAEILKKVNKYGIGPKLLDYTEDILVMEYVEGLKIEDWIKQVENARLLKEVLRKLLNMLYIMDSIGICHLELARPRGHVIISGERPVILDFETASTKTRKSNLTQVLNFLIFKESAISEKIKTILKIKDLDKLRQLLKEYKERRTKQKYLEILGALNLLETNYKSNPLLI